MSKTMRNSLMIIAIVAILFIIIYFGYDMVKTEPVDANVTDSNLVDENAGLDNIINDLFDNVITNEQVDNVVENEDIQEEQKQEDEDESDNKEEVVSSGESVTSKEEKAIELVKKEWGGEDGVYFSNDSIDTQGRYIVSVHNSTNSATLAWYYVDVEKELVTKQ